MRPNTIHDFLALGGQPRVIAHRGFSGRAPENTLAAFSKAIEAGADMIELDVHESKDGELVVIHESDLSRTTNGTGTVGELTLEELLRLDAGTTFSREFAGERMPTLLQALELVRGHILLNVEIKYDDVKHEIVTEKVLSLIHASQMRDQVILSSFDPRALNHSRKIDPEVKTASLYNERLHKGIGPVEIMEQVGSVAFNLRHDQVTVDTVAGCHERGCPVAAYTVNRPKQMQALFDLGVDALFTDRPDLMVEQVKQWKRTPR